jgi:hypothetical protein
VDYAREMLHEQRDSESKARAAEIVARVRALHVDELSTGTWVSFVKKFSGDKKYTYLALKSFIDGEDLWFITNRKGGLTNESFEDLLAESLGFQDFQQLFPSPGLRAAPNYAAPSPESEPWTAPNYTESPSTPVKAQLWEGWPGPKLVRPTHATGPAEPGEE